MNVDKFKKVSNWLSMLTKLACVFSVLLPAGLLFFSFPDMNLITSDPSKSNLFVFFSTEMINKSNTETGAALLTAGIATALVLGVGFAYFTWKISRFFSALSNGESPFSSEQISRLRSTAKGYMTAGAGETLIFSMVYTILLKGQGYHFSVGIGGLFFLGLILYLITEIIRFGLALQKGQVEG